MKKQLTIPFEYRKKEGEKILETTEYGLIVVSSDYIETPYGTEQNLVIKNHLIGNVSIPVDYDIDHITEEIILSLIKDIL